MIIAALRVNQSSRSMQTRSTTSTILVVLVVLFTLPIWIGVAGGLFGLVAGLCGGIFGIFAAIFGVLLSVIAIPFKILFGWGHWGIFPHFHFPGLGVVALVVVIALLLRKGK